MPTTAQNIANAIAAYQRAVRDDRPGAAPRDSAPADGEFASLVKGAIREAVKIGEHSEQLSMAAINGKADLASVVTAVAEAEVTLQTVVEVRDRVIEAYRDIIRMPV